MKSQLWLVTPLSAIAVGSIAMTLQPNQRLAPLIGSSVGALAAAPFLKQQQDSKEIGEQIKKVDNQINQLHNSLTDQRTWISHGFEQQKQLLTESLKQLPAIPAPALENQQILESVQALHKILDIHSRDLAQLKSALDKPAVSDPSVPKTAILYDIENLVFLQGQRLDPARVSELVSLKQVLEALRRAANLGEVVVQRAYGNWVNQILQSFIPQLDALQVEQVAVYGRNRDQRNAADIQLALDAVDIIHKHPEINTFVLVSGDGGFGSVALKLRDYGKTVIGCAYRGSASDSLQRVCHRFILLDNPFDNAASPRENTDTSETSPSIPISEINYPPNATIEEIKKLESNKILELINYYASNADKKNQLENGIDFVVFFNDLKKIIPQFDPLRFGFSKPSEAIGYITEQHNSPICLAVNNTVQKAILCWRDQLPSNSTVRSHEPKPIHTVSTYREIFANEVASDALLLEVGQWLINHRPHNMTTNKTKNLIFEHFRQKQLPISKQGISRALNNYIKAHVLLRNQNSGAGTISLNSGIKTLEDLVQQTQKSFRQAVEERLAPLGETIDENVFAQALPFKSQNDKSDPVGQNKPRIIRVIPKSST